MLVIKPELIERLKQEQGFTSDEQLAVYLGLASTTVRNIRRQQPVTMRTFSALLQKGIAMDLPLKDVLIQRPAAA